MHENNSNQATKVLSIIAGAMAIIAGLAFLVNGLQALLSTTNLSVDEVISAAATIVMGVVFFVGGTESLFAYFRAKPSRFGIYLPIIVLASQAIVWTVHYILLVADGVNPSGLYTARNNLIFLLVFGFAGIFFSVMSWRQKEGVFKTVLSLIGLVIAGVAFLVGSPHFLDSSTVVGDIFGVQVFILMFIACLLEVIFKKKEEQSGEPENK